MKELLKELLNKHTKKELIEMIISHPSTQYHSSGELVGTKVRFGDKWFQKFGKENEEYGINKDGIFEIRHVKFWDAVEYGRVLVLLDKPPYSYHTIAIDWLVPVESKNNSIN